MSTLFILAYIDPGSGALLLQAAVAGTIGVVAVFRRTLASIAARLLGRATQEPAPQDPEPPPAR